MGGRPGGRGGSDGSSNRANTASITSDDRTNSVMITGPQEKINQAKEFMEKSIDKGLPGQKDMEIGSLILKTYPVPAGNAPDVANTLKHIYKSASVRALPNGSDPGLCLSRRPDGDRQAPQVARERRRRYLGNA